MDASMSHLPSSTCFVDSLISEIADIRTSSSHGHARDRDPPRLSTAPQEQAPNVLAALSPRELARIKPIILTLHCLFPNDFLPALDILDRRLVHRLVTTNAAVPAPGNKPVAEQSKASDTTLLPLDHNHPPAGQDVLFLVTSASTVPLHPPGPSSTTPTTTTTHDPEKGYEVRLHAWNCSCPTFAISAFRDLASRLDLALRSAGEDQTGHDRDETVLYPFGGTLPRTTDRNAPPVCKHILACVLFVRCPQLFGADGDGRRRVSMEELAGWCAGWGG